MIAPAAFDYGIDPSFFRVLDLIGIVNSVSSSDAISGQKYAADKSKTTGNQFIGNTCVNRAIVLVIRSKGLMMTFKPKKLPKMKFMYMQIVANQKKFINLQGIASIEFNL